MGVNNKDLRDKEELIPVEFFGKYKEEWVKMAENMYLKGLNQTEAYMDAYKNSNKSSAKSSASRLVKSKKFQEFLEDYSKELGKQMKSLKDLDVELAVRTIRDLALNAESEKVKLDASSLLLKFRREAPDLVESSGVIYALEIGDGELKEVYEEDLLEGDYEEI